LSEILCEKKLFFLVVVVDGDQIGDWRWMIRGNSRWS